MDLSAKLDMSLDDMATKNKAPAQRGGKGSGGPNANGNTGKRRETRRRAPPPYRKPSGSGGSNSVYVGNLSWEVRWQDLKDHFNTVGRVTRADVIMEGERSKGWGIVSFASSSDMNKAIDQLDGTDLLGRSIHVREDREADSSRPNRGNNGYNKSYQNNQRGGNFGNRGNFREEPVLVQAKGGQVAVYVGNLSFDTSWQNLKDHFKTAGIVDRAEVMLTSDGRSRGWGLVIFHDDEGAQTAIEELHESELQGRKLQVREDRGVGTKYDEADDQDEDGADEDYDVDEDEDDVVETDDAAGVPTSSLYVGNLSYQTSWQNLKDHFKQTGAIPTRADVIQKDGRSAGWGIVGYSTIAEAAAALQQLQETELDGRVIYIKYDNK